MSRAPVNLIAQIESPDGRVDTYTPASRDPRKVPTEVEFTTKSGVGDESQTFVLPRGNRRQGEIESGKQLRLVGAGNYEAARGRVSGQPRSTQKGITYQGIGNWEMLKDAVFPFLGIDQDLSRWTEMSITEKLRLAALNIDVASLSWATEGGGLVLAFPAQALPAQCGAWAWYTAPPGTVVDHLIYDGEEPAGGPGGYTAPRCYFHALDHDTGASPVSLTLDGTERTANNNNGATRFVSIDSYSNGSAATPTAGMRRQFTKLSPVGDHGIDALTASNILRYALPIAAPDLEFDDDSIDTTSFEFAQLVQEGELRLEDLALKLNGCHLFDIGVYGWRFYFQAPKTLDDPGDYEWELSPYRGDHRNIDDESWDEKGPYNGVWVLYDDVTTGGRPEMVGPYGTANYLDPNGSDLLIDTSDDNPVNVNMPGRPRHAVLKVNERTTYDMAVQMGAIFLRDHAYGNRSGDFESSSAWVKNRAGAWEPAYKVKSDDRIKFTDSNRVHKVAGTSYSTITKTVKGSLDNLPYTLDAILERMGIALVEIRT